MAWERRDHSISLCRILGGQQESEIDTPLLQTAINICNGLDNLEKMYKFLQTESSKTESGRMRKFE